MRVTHLGCPSLIASLASWESWMARLLLSGRGWHYGLSPRAGVPSSTRRRTMVSGILLRFLGGASYGHYRARASWVLQTFHAAGRKLAPARESLEQVSQATHALREPSGALPAAPAPPAVPPFLVQLFGTTAALVAGLTEVLLLLYLLLASGDLFLRKLVEVLPVFRDKRTAVEMTEQVQQAVTQYLVTTLVINIGQGVVV